MIENIKQDKKSGFLLIEALFGIMITILCVFSLSQILLSFKHYQGKSHLNNEVVFSYVQFKQFLDKFDEVTVRTDLSNSQKIILSPKINHKTTKDYRIEFYKNEMVRLTTPNGGHMPLLLNLRAARFYIEPDYIRLHVTELDGKKSDLIFKPKKMILKDKADEETDKKVDKGKG